MSRRQQRAQRRAGTVSYNEYMSRLSGQNGVYSWDNYEKYYQKDQDRLLRQQYLLEKQEKEERDAFHKYYQQQQATEAGIKWQTDGIKRTMQEKEKQIQHAVDNGNKWQQDGWKRTFDEKQKQGGQEWEKWLRSQGLIKEAEAEEKKSPVTKYNELPEEKKGKWLRPSSKEVNERRDINAVKTWVNSYKFDPEKTQAEIDDWKAKLEENNRRAEEEQARIAEQRGDRTSQELNEEAWELKGKANPNYLQSLDLNGIEDDLTGGNGWTTEYIKARPEDYDRRQEEWDGWLYDKIYGEGSYSQRVKDLQTDEEADALEAEVSELWDRLENRTLHELPETNRGMKETREQQYELEDLAQNTSIKLKAAQRAARYAQDKLDELEAQQKFENGYTELMAGQTEPTMPGYIKANDKGKTSYDSMAEMERGVRTDDVHRIYSFINGGNEFMMWAVNREDGTSIATDEYGGALFMNDGEIAQFNDYYNKGDYDGAKAFFKGLQPYLNDRYRPIEEINTQEAAKQLPVSTNIASIMMQGADTMMTPIREAAGWLGDESVKDENSKWYAGARQAQDIQDTTAEDIEKSLGKKYGKTIAMGYRSMMNSLRNVYNGIVTAGFGLSGKLQTVASLAVFASQIYQESVYENLSKTKDYDKARGLAGLDALMETLEEMLPYETMLEGANGHPAIYIFKNALSEAGEEFTGATVGEYVKGLITGRNSLEKRADQIFNERGYYDDDGKWVDLSDDDREAMKQADIRAINEWGQNVKDSTIGGALGGEFGAAYGAVDYAAQTWETGHNIRSEENTTEGKTGPEQLVELGEGMKDGTRSKEIADELRVKIDAKERLTNYEIGKLANTVAEETGAEQAQVVKDTVERQIRDELTTKDVDAEQAKVYAEIIARYVMDGELSAEDRARLAENRNAIEVWRSYNTSTGSGVVKSMQLGAEVAQATEPQRSVMQTIGELTSKMKGPAGSSAMFAEVQNAVKNTKTVHEAVDMLRERNSALISEDYANKMKEALDNDKAAQKSKTFLDDAMKVRMSAMLYDTQAPKTNLSAETSKALFEAAQAEAAEADRMRLEQNPVVEAGKGTATFKDAAYGTKAWQDAVKPYSKNVRNQMGAVALAAQAFGHTVEFIDDPGRSMVNGWQMAHNGNIVINIATGMNHSMLATMAHEMTHWLEHNSETGYKALRRFVIDNMRKLGRNVEQDIMETIRNQDRVRLMEEQEKGSSTIESLSFSDAVAELVAKSSEDIFTSREFKEAIAKESPSLYKKIKDHVKAIVKRLDSAIEAATGLSMSREARALRNVRDEIAHVWLEAREEAVNRQRGEAEESAPTQKEIRQMSVEQLDEEYKQAVKNDDVETQQMIVDIAAEENGYTETAYHGTPLFGFTRFAMDAMQNMIFVAYDENIARTYTMNGTGVRSIKEGMEKGGEGTYKLYTDPGTQLVVDAKGEKWNRIKFDDPDFIEYMSRWDPGLRVFKTRDIASWAKWRGYDSVRINNVWDNGAGSLRTGKFEGDIGIFFDRRRVKSADPVTYDNDGDFILPSDRFTRLNEEGNDIRYSVEQGDDPVNITNDAGEPMVTLLPGNTVAATQFSLSSYTDLNERTKMIKALKKAGYTEEEINHWMDQLDTIAAKIATDRVMYDFVADRTKKFLKPNGDVYKKTLDANTMCKKTRLYNGTFNEVQHMMPNTVFMPEDLIDLFNIMKDMNLETPCGFCYVQSRRRHLGTYTQEWLDKYKGDYIPTVDEVTTSDGLERLKEKHPKTYEDFVKAMNKKGVNNPKLVQQRTDYRGEIRRMTKRTVEYMRAIGGLRMQSFSDFETVHMLDVMQAVMDMKAKGLTAQAYTKVPDFAWVFGPTGIKINLSLVGKGTGLDANGNLVFDDSEGINHEEAFRIREAYSDNVGTILVGINDDHIIAAMGDSRIDFIIPFHKSGWSENELKHMRGLDHYEDYTDSQNEYNIKTDENGNTYTEKTESNVDPLSYWNFDEDGEFNARKYLKWCKDNKVIPKFSQFLVDNGDGSFSLPKGKDTRSTNIREGYWKTLIDFKMYNNEGIGARQQLVQPEFNMEKAMDILNNYDGSHRALEGDKAAAQEFVKRYKEAHPLDSVRTQYSVEESPDVDVERFMMGLSEHHMNTLQEKVMYRQWKELKGGVESLRFIIDDIDKQIRKIEDKKNGGKLSAWDRKELSRLKNMRVDRVIRLEKMQKELVKVTKDKGYARLMFKNDSMMSNLVSGRTAGELKNTVAAMNDELENVTKEMSERAGRLKELAEKEAVLKVRQMFNRAGLKQIAAKLKSEMGSTLENEAIENRLALIALKMNQNQFDRETTMELADMIVGRIAENYDSYIINELKGSTINLSPAQMKELKANHRSLADIREELAGTGIKVQVKNTNTLDENWEEMCELIPSLDRQENALNQLDALLQVIKSEKETTGHNYGSDEGMLQVSGQILEAAQELLPEIVKDPKKLANVREVLKFVQEISGEVKDAAQSMEEISNMLNKLQKKGRAVSTEAETLSKNTQDAIEYFNELAEQSDAAMWKSERIKLIEQLKSENTQNIMAEQEKWKKRIEKDKTAREMMESNLELRRKINTNYGRIRKLLLNETDQKNVPEYMKSLARYMVRQITENDLTGRKISGFQKKDLAETLRVLDIMETMDERFTPADLRMIDDEEAQAMVAEALADLEDGIGFYNASTKGSDILVNLQGFRNSLERINDAVTTITNVINAERQLSFWQRKMDVADGAKQIAADMGKSRFRGELKGRGNKAVNAVNSAVVYGNTTPVYFFKNLQNRGMDMVWQDIEESEHRNGLEIQRAKDFISALSDRTKYKEWAGQKIKATLGGRTQEITIENAMEIYAIWRREQTLNPEMSKHIEKGGIYIQQEEEEKGKLHRERETQRATRLTADEVAALYGKMTDAQKEFIERMVGYLSNEMSGLGNEASMRMYGIKKYKETYYFPMKVWDGVKSARSDKGISGTDENRSAHKSWSKRRVNNANNALVIGNFVTDAVNHIVEMINYNTMAPAIENMNKILNYQFTEGTTDDATNRNLRVMFQENYGKEALRYMEQFMKDLNGGTVQDQRKTLRDRALSMFKKNAVAGSLSVVAQQPLSYIRASMMINPKYLAPSIVNHNWKDSYHEMQKYSGVAVIKDMGRFDMNFGQSAKDYITPETGKSIYSKISDALAIPPQLADRMTWTWMWAAVKAEQHAAHPEMDVKSEQFMQTVAKRFNEVMRRTQVYDSVLVKSSNMRSNNFTMKLITSFMAEPTLSLNVLADAVRNVGQEGGKTMLAKAGATFVISAVMQALVKGAMGTGRSPDKKKNLEENFLNKWMYNLMNEINPLGMIPGFSDLIEVLKTGELKDDAMGAIGKLTSIVDKTGKIINGKGSGWYRDLEDTLGQFAQLFTNIPAKNVMRDARAMMNFITGGGAEVITGDTYAKRATSGAVLKYQALENLHTADNITGTVNKWLGDAGYATDNSAYYRRMYEAEKTKNKEKADDIREYLKLGKGVKEDTIVSNMRTLTKGDDELTYSERIKGLRKEGMKDSDIASWILKEYKDGHITKAQAEKLWVEADPSKDKNDAYFKFEQAEWEKQTGNDVTDSDWFRINSAIDGKNDAEYTKAVSELAKHGYDEEKITEHAVGRVMDRYKEGKITKDEAGKQLKKYNSKLTANDIWFKLDLADYKKETGNEKASGTYYRLTDAVNANRAEEISKVIKDLMKHGVTKEKIKSKLSDWKSEYLKADSAGRLKIKDALTKAYKAAGYTAADAQKTIDNWLKEKKKKNN